MKNIVIDWGTKSFKDLDCWFMDKKYGEFVKKGLGGFEGVHDHGTFVLEKLKLWRIDWKFWIKIFWQFKKKISYYWEGDEWIGDESGSNRLKWWEEIVEKWITIRLLKGGQL